MNRGSESADPQRVRNCRGVAAVACVALLVVTVVACSGGGSGGSHTVTGKLALTQILFIGNGDSSNPSVDFLKHNGGVCHVGGGGADVSDPSTPNPYQDVPTGQVVVKDDAGKIVGTGQISATGRTEESGGQFVACDFDFTIKSVPSAAFYTFQVAGHPGSPATSKADLAAQNYTVTITL